MFDNISILAGSKALEIIKDEGLNLSRVKVLAGASGAAKFLVLTGIDRALMSLLKDRKEKLHLIGSSIGSFRMSTYAQKNPFTALDLLESGYINQIYPNGKRTSKKEIGDKSLEIINSYISDTAVDDILNNPIMSISFLAGKSKFFLKYENNLIQFSSLVSAGFLNFISRKNLKYFFERALFSSSDFDFNFNDNFKVNRFELNTSNFKRALLSSGSIPLAMNGVSNIPNIKGNFRDGGMLDYHLDMPFLPSSDSDSLVLYPHFYENITPGWLDKFSKRKGNSKNMKNTILIAPSKKFVASLPYQKIPDRKDFNLFSDSERLKYWNQVVMDNKRLGDELFEAIESGKIRDIIKEV